MNSKKYRSIILFMPLFILACGFTGNAEAKNTIPTVLLPAENSPLVTFRIQFKAGSINDPKGKRGLTFLTASMLTDAGTRKKPYKEIIDRFYPMATSVYSQVDKEVTTIVGTVHIDNLDEFYSLLREMLLEPGFRDEDFERLKTNQINYLEKQLRGNNDEELGKQALNAFLYEGHPYGYPEQGVIEELKSITIDDVKKHYRRVFTRDNVTLGLAGGYTEAFLKAVLDDLSKLPEGKPAPVNLDNIEMIQDIEVLAVEKECRSTAISMGFPLDVTRSDKDFYPLLIANSYFGEHRTFNGVLMIRMRELRGLNYGDYSYIENFIQEGGSTFPLPNIPRRRQFFHIWIRPVLHKNRHFALRQAIRELEKLVNKGLSKEDFELTRKFLNNYSKLWAQSQSRRLGYLMDSRFYGIDDYIANLPSRLDRLTVEDVNRAIKKHLNYRNIRVAVITKGAEEFLRNLIENKPSPITYASEKMAEDILKEDKEIEVYPLNINKEKSRVVKADDLFEK